MEPNPLCRHCWEFTASLSVVLSGTHHCFGEAAGLVCVTSVTELEAVLVSYSLEKRCSRVVCLRKGLAQCKAWCCLGNKMSANVEKSCLPVGEGLVWGGPGTCGLCFGLCLRCLECYFVPLHYWACQINYLFGIYRGLEI